MARRPGVTDDEGTSAQNALADFLNEPLDTHTQHIFSKRLYLLENDLPAADLRRIAEELLGNKLINRFEVGRVADGIRDYTPRPGGGAEAITEIISLTGLSDAELVQLSKDNIYALNLEEMRAMRDYFAAAETQAERQAAGLPADPTDCELEIIAQTWSEHCKHKEFSALINYKDLETGEEKQIDSLFKTYIKDATAEVDRQLRANGNDWLVKVFSRQRRRRAHQRRFAVCVEGRNPQLALGHRPLRRGHHRHSGQQPRPAGHRHRRRAAAVQYQRAVLRQPRLRRAAADRAAAPAPHSGRRAQGHRGRRQQVGRADRERRHRVRRPLRAASRWCTAAPAR